MGKIYLFNLFAESHENFFEITDKKKIILKKLRYTRRPHAAKIHTPFKTETHTLFDGTYSYRLNKGVSPGISLESTLYAVVEHMENVVENFDSL